MSCLEYGQRHKRSVFPRGNSGTEQQLKQTCIEVQEGTTRGIYIPKHPMMKTAIERCPSMDRENQEDGSLPYRNGTVQNQETAWRCKSTVASPPGQVPPRSKMPPLPRTPPVPSDNSDRTQTSKPVGPPPRYVNIHQHYVVCHWNPAGVSERMWSVHLDASISVEYRTLGGHSCRPSQ